MPHTFDLPAGAAAQIRAERITARRRLHDLSITVTARSRLAITGENGRGKTTLLHVLAGLLAPEQGTVTRIGTVGVAEQDLTGETVGSLTSAALEPSLTALDMVERATGDLDEYADALDAAVRLDAWDAERRVDVALEALGARPGTPLLRAADVVVEGRLDDPVSLTVAAGDRMLVTGANGAGKSTLLSVLGGRLEPTAGSVDRSGTARVAILAQEVPSWDGVRIPGDTFGLLDAEARETPPHRMSLGQQRRLHLALTLAGRPDLIILDEPTNHLSAALVDEMTAAIRSTGAAVVVATHDRQLLRDLADWPRLHLPAPH